MAVMATTQDLERERTTVLWESVVDVVPNVNRGLLQEIAELRHQGIEVDGNNGPSPKNDHPIGPATQTIGQWVTPTICPGRADVNCHNNKGVWRLHIWLKFSEITELSLFRMALPEQWVRGVLIPATDEEILGDNITLQELYVFLGCHFFMACFEGIYYRRFCWFPKTVSIRERSPFRLQKYMDLQRFISNISAVRFTNKPFPSFLDRFHDVQQIINNFNEHYLENYIPSWISCLGESVKYFLDKFCPGFMSVTRKRHPLGNDYHIITDVDEGNPVMYWIKIQEGKDRPRDANGKWSFPSKCDSSADE